MSITADMKLLKIFTILLGVITSISCMCDVKLPEDPLLRPKIFQIIGWRKMELPIAANTGILRLFENQKIELQCDTEFTSPYDYINKDKASVECNDGGYYYRHDVYFECSPLKWKLYKSLPYFHWCENDMTSYMLARPAKDNNRSRYEYLAGICYDTVANSFKSLYYRWTPKYVDNFHPDILPKFYHLVYEIQHYRDIFRKRSVSVQDYDSDVFREWLNYSQYNLSSILQNPRVNRQFYVDSLLDLIWWPRLRLGNWRRYEMALENYIENANHSYDILAGVSDVVKVPISESCTTNFSLVDFSDNVNRKIPFYVWNYLRATDNSSEFVVIGVNSPFYEFYAEKDVIFCLDKCQEIPWLKTKSFAFRYNIWGIIFCCSVDEVLQSQRLDGFPKTFMDLSLLLPPPPIDEYVSTTTVESEYQDNADNNDDNDNNYD